MAIGPGPRSVSRLTRQTLALVLAGERGPKLHELTAWRPRSALAFAGKYRVIDFPLSNCFNSGIRRIQVLTQYKAHSLIRHVTGAWAGLRRGPGGPGPGAQFVEILPASQRSGTGWYQGSADAVFQNLDILRTHRPDFVLILGGNHIYTMDYGPMLAAHVERGADLSIACVEMSQEAAREYGVLEVDGQGRVTRLRERPWRAVGPPGRPGRALVSMGVYVFNTGFLYEQLVRDADTPRSSHDFARDLIPRVLKSYRVLTWPFRDIGGGEAYWRDPATLDRYWEANIELLDRRPVLNLYDRDWPVTTRQAPLPPARFTHDPASGRQGEATEALVSGGCVVSGARVNRSLLSSNVRVGAGASVEDSLLLSDVSVGPDCRIRRAIVDRGCRLPGGLRVGFDPGADAARFRVTERGVVLLTPEMLGQRTRFTR